MWLSPGRRKNRATVVLRFLPDLYPNVVSCTLIGTAVARIKRIYEASTLRAETIATLSFSVSR